MFINKVNFEKLLILLENDKNGYEINKNNERDIKGSFSNSNYNIRVGMGLNEAPKLIRRKSRIYIKKKDSNSKENKRLLKLIFKHKGDVMKVKYLNDKIIVWFEKNEHTLYYAKINYNLQNAWQKGVICNENCHEYELYSLAATFDENKTLLSSDKHGIVCFYSIDKFAHNLF